MTAGGPATASGLVLSDFRNGAFLIGRTPQDGAWNMYLSCSRTKLMWGYHRCTVLFVLWRRGGAWGHAQQERKRSTAPMAARRRWPEPK